MGYDFKSVEKKWQDKWEETGVFHAVDFFGQTEVLRPC